MDLPEQIRSMLTHPPIWLYAGASMGTILLLGLATRRIWQAGQRYWWRHYSHNTLEQMSWQEFEWRVADTFRALDYKVQLRGGAKADGGVDVFVENDNGTYIVQCKHWVQELVGVSVVREMVGAAEDEGVNGFFIVTVRGYTRDAIDFAHGKDIRLLDGKDLLAMIEKARGGNPGWRPITRTSTRRLETQAAREQAAPERPGLRVSSRAYNYARRLFPDGTDIRQIEQDWQAWVTAKNIRPQNNDALFISYCKNRGIRQG